MPAQSESRSIELSITVASSKATATAAARAVHAAINGGDPQAMADTMVLQKKGRAMAQEVFDAMSPEQKVRYRSADGLLAELLCATTASTTPEPTIVGEYFGARGMGPTLEADENYRTVHTVRVRPDGSTGDAYQVYQQTPDGWRWVISDGLVLKRLVETGLMKPPAPKS